MRDSESQNAKVLWLSTYRAPAPGPILRPQAALTKMDFVPGVKQKLLSKRVPHDANWLQLPPHPLLSQNATFCVADRQLVPGALRQAAPPLYTVHEPPQTFWDRLLQ